MFTDDDNDLFAILQDPAQLSVEKVRVFLVRHDQILSNGERCWYALRHNPALPLLYLEDLSLAGEVREQYLRMLSWYRNGYEMAWIDENQTPTSLAARLSENMAKVFWEGHFDWEEQYRPRPEDFVLDERDFQYIGQHWWFAFGGCYDDPEHHTSLGQKIAKKYEIEQKARTWLQYKQHGNFLLQGG